MQDSECDSDSEQEEAARRLESQVLYYERDKLACQLKLCSALQLVRRRP